VSAAEHGQRLPHVRVEATRGLTLRLGELWRYRDLLFFLAWRDVKVRYKQTALGAAWAILQPVLTMVVFSIVFGTFVKVDSEGLPYPIFVYTALLPWTYFASALASGSASVVANQSLITKVFFPRLIIPVSAVLVPVIDFVLGFGVLIGLMAWYGIWPGVAVLALPAFLALAVVSVVGVALWLSALNVRYRDVPYAVPFLVQVWLYATPVVYPLSVLDGRWQWLFSLNPMAGVVEGFRWALLDKPAPSAGLLLVSAAAAVVVAVTGLAFFRRFERSFADVI
jgi:lipopolysaccharide transport system permease protein